MTNVKCTNNISFMLNDKKEAFICPWEDQRKNIDYIPLKLFFSNKNKITMISCVIIFQFSYPKTEIFIRWVQIINMVN